MVQAEPFIPFFGVIEDVNDPEKIGRVRVRVHGYHSPSAGMIPTEMLQWFSCVVSNSAAQKGLGSSPTGYEIGTTVFGYFVEKTFQTGIVIGGLNGFTQGTSDVSALARGEDHPVAQARESNRITSIQGPMQKGEWGEAPYTNKAVYPNNHVFETRTRIVKEFDGTEGEERIHEFHPSGTYYDIDADGNKTVKVVGDNYELIAGNDSIFINGDVNMTVTGDANWYIGGNMNIQVDGDKSEVVQGNVKEYYAGDWSILSGGSVGVDGSTIDLNSGVASGNSGIPITIPKEYDIEFVRAAVLLTSRYAQFDEPSEINKVPDDYPQDTPPSDYDGEPIEEAEVEDEEKPTPELEDCRIIELPINYNIRLSPNYTIGDLSRDIPIFPHSIRSQVNLTEQEIVCNLQALAENILEPLREEYGTFRINSGFRVGSGRSQHNRGQAADIQEPSWSNQKHLEVAEWMAKNLPVDQLICEHGNSIWIHVSFDRNKSAQRGELMTMINGRFMPGLKLFY